MSKSNNKKEGSNNPSPPLFSRTGNPFADTGLAVLCQLSGKTKPEDLTVDDIRKQVDYITDIYSHKE